MGKNRIINGAMEIDQRNAGSSVTATTSTYNLDRWTYYSSGSSSNFTVGQNLNSITPPSGFINYIGYQTISTYSPTGGDYFHIAQNIEGLNVADLGWGTANAKTIKLSFWVRSSLTGTFGGSILNSSNNRSYPFEYTISSANTWEQKSVTIAGDTSGTWLTTNGTGIKLRISLGAGSSVQGTSGSWSGATYWSCTGQTPVVSTNGATFYITGVQLEVGSVATEFERRPYGTELQLCQRYYFQSWGSGSFSNVGSGYVGQVLPSPNNASTYGASSFPVSMRASPTVTLYDSLGASGKVSQPAVANGLAATTGSIAITGFFAVTKASTTFTTGTPVIAQFTASIEL